MIGVDEPYDNQDDRPADETPQQPSIPASPFDIAVPAVRHNPVPPPAKPAGEMAAAEAMGAAEDAASVGLPPPKPTGDERVDAALARFAELTAAPVTDHVAVFEDVHRRLQDVLAAVDHDAVDHDAVDQDQPAVAAPDPPAGAHGPPPGAPVLSRPDRESGEA